MKLSPREVDELWSSGDLTTIHYVACMKEVESTVRAVMGAFTNGANVSNGPPAPAFIAPDEELLIQQLASEAIING